MKKKLLITITAAISALAGVAQAQTTIVTPAASSGTNYQDAETLARAFLQYNTDHYTEMVSGQEYLNGQYQSIEIDSILDQSLIVTNLAVNYTNIPLPNPLAGVPLPASGLWNVNVQVAAWDANGNLAAQGSFFTNDLPQGAPISVMMFPQFPPTAVQIQAGLDPSQINVQLTGAQGWEGWSYDPSTGLLTISVYNGSATVGYTITDNSGTVLASGQLPFFQAPSRGGANTNSALSLNNVGGYVSLPLGNNGYNYANLACDSFVQRNGVGISAKVIGVPDLNAPLNLYLDSSAAVAVEVRQWSATGTLQKVPVTVTIEGQYGSEIYESVTTSAPIGKAIITVIPTNGSPQTAFFIEVSRGSP